MRERTIIYALTIALIGTIIGFSAGLFIVSQPGTSIRLSGAGATFPAPLYQKWSLEFNSLTGIQVDYEGIGSGGGITQHTAKTVDFAASDPPMKTDEWLAAPGTLQLPMTIGCVVVGYRLPGISEHLNLTGSVIAQIYARWITQWNNATIQNLNKGVTLPNQPITVVHRSDSSGTTAVFTSFLSDESAMWNSTYGASKTINWDPDTIGQKGNPGVAQYLQTNDYSIGYIELAYAIESNINYALIQNADLVYSSPSLATVADAADYASTTLPAGDENWESVGNYFKLGPTCGDAYPISSFSYMLVYQELNVIPGMTLTKARALTNWLWWCTHQAQSYAPALYYVEIPATVIAINEASLRSITYNGAIVNTWE
ncbi:MAG: phosphate ABC transporter substrate-binding protein PstS [Promethearchaeota archaeon]